MSQKQLLSVLLVVLSACFSIPACAVELQRVVSKAEYQMTDIDTPATARMYALKKAEEQILRDAVGDYVITTHITGQGDVNTTSAISLGRIDSQRVLSEEIGACTDVSVKDNQCYHIQLEAMVDAGYVSPTDEQLEESQKALQLAEELLSN